MLVTVLWSNYSYENFLLENLRGETSLAENFLKMLRFRRASSSRISLDESSFVSAKFLIMRNSALTSVFFCRVCLSINFRVEVFPCQTCFLKIFNGLFYGTFLNMNCSAKNPPSQATSGSENFYSEHLTVEAPESERHRVRLPQLLCRVYSFHKMKIPKSFPQAALNIAFKLKKYPFKMLKYPFPDCALRKRYSS